ncbi:MAG: FmdB family zinc ribbon protein [Bacillota bacterium]
MPIFEFRCIECGNLFEKLFKTHDEEVDIQCPKCKSESFERVISRTSHVMGPGKGGDRPKPKITSKSCSAGSDCMTLEIPGPDD